MVKKKSTKNKGIILWHFSVVDLIVFGVIGVLVVVPDPVDFLTFGLPVIESLTGLIYVVARAQQQNLFKK